MPSFAKAAGWRGFSVISSVVANLLTIRLCARAPEQLPTGAFGLIQIALLLLGFLPLVDGGFRMAINRQLLADPDPKQRRRFLHFGQRLYAYLTCAALVAGVALLGAYALLRSPSIQTLSPLWFMAMGAAGALAFASQSQTSLLIGLGHQWRTFAITSLTSWLNLLGVSLGLSLHWGAWTFPTAIAASAIVTFFISWIQIRLVSEDLSLLGAISPADFQKTFREIRTTSFSAFKNQVATAALYSADPILVDLLSRNPLDTDRYAVTTRIFLLTRSLLQSSDEALWPKIAQDRTRGGELSVVLSRVNAWIHGATGAALCVTVPPFIAAYTRADWTPSTPLILLFCARGMITGLCSQPAYFLYGDGQFESLGRSMRRELFLALILSLPLGIAYGGTGVAAAFLCATAGGTLIPIPIQYTRAVGWSLRAFLAGAWSRAGVAALIAGLFTLALAPKANSTLTLFLIGSVGAILGAAPGGFVDIRKNWTSLFRAK